MDDGQVLDDSGEGFGLSRRALIGGLGAAGAVGLAGALVSSSPAGAVGDVTDAIEAPTAGLVYLPLDAFAFDVAGTAATSYRLYQPETGMQPATTGPGTPPRYLYASLPIPAGAVIQKINVSYVGQPIISIAKRTMGTTTYTQVFGPVTTSNVGANPRSQTFTVQPSVAIAQGSTYTLEVFCLAGESILGAEIGYIPAPQAFIPYTGNAARVFDSRDTTRFNPDEERTIDLSSKLIATARAAVVNVTATETTGPGFVAAFADGIAWPNNSTVNFSSANLTVANGAVVTMTGGKIKLRCGPAATHVLVDVVGSLL